MSYQEVNGHIVATCYHCGNKGIMKVAGRYDSGPIYDEEEIFFEEYNWRMLICPVCKQMSLLERYTDASMWGEDGQQEYQSDIIYPRKNFIDKDVPLKIRSSFESAVKIKKIDTTLCVIGLRRVLELVCKDKKAPGKTLEEMLQNLVKKNILPPRFDSACEIIRKLGNNAVHGDEAVFYVYEVDELISVLSVLLTYLYTLPAKLDKLKKKLDDPKGMM